MNKRLKKKLGNRYNLLIRAQRQKQKRKGMRHIEYALIPIGEKDKSRLDQEGYDLDYPFATHWFIEIVVSTHFYKEPYIIYVYPCTSTGRSDTNSFFEVIYAGKLDEVITVFEKTVDDMKNDKHIASFWDSNSLFS
ncbi:hypothetical protein [Ornithinibacillus contaminans]|uniref:hypothetical protein n=1 Tax=Ornithinibacillus contaminans TaxID=694055 RepID=UPI00064DC51D|nr:hypothetical protein [Ornithinibacillus contaminans]